MKYTTEQQEAINHRNGNLKIIACAGSGKTTVMSEMIANLVANGEDRNKIVAFTFTEKAAHSLKLRIREALNVKCPDAPYLGGMYIGTIHAFALQKLKDLVPRFRNYEVLNEVTRVIWLSKKYMELNIESLGGDRRYFYRVQQFLNTADIVRDNEISDESLDKIPTFKEVYYDYLKLLSEDRYLDYSGILFEFVKLLDTNLQIQKDVQKNVKHLVVDEYQDVNHIQEKLISLIANPGTNVCVVGDDDQSIFEFQGAEVRNIIDFEKKYPEVKIIKLEKNYRCPAEIIEAAGNLIRRNRGRIEKSILPGDKDGKIIRSEKGDVYKVEFDDIQNEVNFVIGKIKELRGCLFEEDGEKRGLDYGDMAIIVRTRKSAQRFIELFRQASIPFTLKGTGGLFQRLEIEFVRYIFCYLADRAAEWSQPHVSLADIEKLFNGLGWSHIDWVVLEQEIDDLKREILSIGSQNPDPGKRRIFLQDYFYKLAEMLGLEGTNFPNEVMYDFGRLSTLVSEFETIHGWINHYYFQRFVDFMNGYAQDRTDEGGLEDPTHQNSINILTVHQAKGLEFPVVFIPDLSKRRFPSQRRNKKPRTHITDTVFDLQSYCSGDEGERRLFYVASTRTKKFLFITRSRVSDTGTEAAMSNYFIEFDHDIIQRRNVPDPTEREKGVPQAKPDMDLLPTSFTDLRQYIVCPYRYQLQQLMGFKPILNPAYGYGLQVHNLLNHLNKRYGNEIPPLEEVEALVENDFFLRFTRDKPFENMKNKAKEILSTYIKQYGGEFPLNLETEKPFEMVMGGALISGQIDLIQKIDPESKEVKEVSILDYKTEKEKREDPDAKDLMRLQLRLYAIAGGKALGLDPKTAKIHYLTEDVRDEVDVSKEKLDETKEKLFRTVEGIKQGNFTPCPGQQCASCDIKRVCHAKRA